MVVCLSLRKTGCAVSVERNLKNASILQSFHTSLNSLWFFIYFVQLLFINLSSHVLMCVRAMSVCKCSTSVNNRLSVCGRLPGAECSFKQQCRCGRLQGIECSCKQQTVGVLQVTGG